MEANHLDPQLIKIICLISSKERLKCRKIKAVFRYHMPNANRNAEEYVHHLLLPFYPFRHEGESVSSCMRNVIFEASTTWRFRYS